MKLKALFFICIFFLSLSSRAAEFFLKIEKHGYYSVTIADQTIISASNTFRFFDLAAGSHNFSVTNIYGGGVLFSGTVNLQNNYRKVVRLDQTWNLWSVAELEVHYSQWYKEKEADTVIVKDTVLIAPTLPVNEAMPPDDFAQVKQAISQQSYESGKVETAKSITRQNKLTTDQIRQICLLFSYESSKLEYAKFAYDYCVDKKNYYQVKSVFGYSSSSSELEQYLERK